MNGHAFIDKVLAILALLVLAGYLGILILYVPHPTLIIVLVLTVVLAGFDFFRMTFQGKG